MYKRWVYLSLILILSPSFAISPTAAQPPSTGIDPDIQAKADAGLAQAEYLVGLEYFNGDKVARDFAQAAVWLRKAADQGLAQAQYRTGLPLHEGIGRGPG